MNINELRALQAPLKERYKQNPESAVIPTRAEGIIEGEDIVCRIPTSAGTTVAGLHRATGGDGSQACSADMLMESLVACAGVTLKAVATAMRIPLMRAKVVAAEAEVPLAMAEAFKKGNMGVMDYYKMKNIVADTTMRNNIGSTESGSDDDELK